jgi:selenium metabolism protein YedF
MLRRKKQMIQVNAMGDACPIPVVKTKNAIKELNGAGQVETLVDNEIAVQNLTKMANQKGYGVTSEKLEENKFRVVMTVGETDATETEKAVPPVCIPDARGNTVVVISSSYMGVGDEELGGVLIKGFIYALSQQDVLPKTILFYNGGAKLTCEDSPTIEDLKSLEAQGVEILTCGTCLNHYGLSEKLQVGGVTNMYDIVEKMTGAGLIVKP